MNKVLVEQDPSPMKLEVLGVDDWPVAREAVGVSKREYTVSETSYIIEGSGEIKIPDNESVSFSAGDLVTVMPETCCIWNITEAIERHYSKG
jgi:uncharacterized cupin superfamily protein